jgi:hypothetical protein
MRDILDLPDVDNRNLEDRLIEEEFLRKVELGKKRRGTA